MENGAPISCPCCSLSCLHPRKQHHHPTNSWSKMTMSLSLSSPILHISKSFWLYPQSIFWIHSLFSIPTSSLSSSYFPVLPRLLWQLPLLYSFAWGWLFRLLLFYFFLFYGDAVITSSHISLCICESFSETIPFDGREFLHHRIDTFSSLPRTVKLFSKVPGSLKYSYFARLSTAFDIRWL